MSLQECEVLYCVCGHSEEEHYNDGGDSTAKYGCEAGNGDGSLCRCDDFTLPFEPDEWFEPDCYRCGRDAVNCECAQGFAYDERDLY